MKSRLEALVSEMLERGILFEDAVGEFEKQFILSVLKRVKGNLSKAAEELRLNRNTLSKRVGKFYQDGHMVGVRYSHGKPKAALIPSDEFQSAFRARSHTLDDLSAEFDTLLSRMQTPKARKGMKAAFNASPTQLGGAAAKAARKRRETVLD